MPICGFNKKMLEGLRQFNEGLIEHGLIRRSKLKEQSLETTLSNELKDMERFLIEIPNINNSHLRNVIQGLTLYAKGVYGLADVKDIDNYKTFCQSLSRLFYGMDNKFYKELEGQSDDMKKLIGFLNESKRV